VTIALHILEGKSAIRSKRARVIIRDRERLKRLAGPAYSEPSFDLGPQSGLVIHSSDTELVAPSVRVPSEPLLEHARSP